MRKIVFTFTSVMFAWTCTAEPVCVNGVCYPDEESARAAGALGGSSGKDISDLQNLLHVVEPSKEPVAGEATPLADRVSRRVGIGYMEPSEFKAFLEGKPSVADVLGRASVATVFLIILLGGLLMNLTPCVLPLVPVSLALVGRGVHRGTAYGLGMTLSYGALGLAAAFGGLAFGVIQSSPWFNLVVAAVFIMLGLATCEVFFIDFSRFRSSPKSGGTNAERGLLRPFLLGAGTAVLAGACVAPILLATLVLTAKWFAAGRVWAIALPFVLGAGMGLPWPFITAGLSVLPKPGAWMRWVNRLFAVLLFGMAVWYGWLAWNGFKAHGVTTSTRESSTTTADADMTRPRLVIVGAPWCKNCTAMERTTLREPSVMKMLESFNVTHVEVQQLKEVTNYPELNGLNIEKMGIPAYVVIETKADEEKK